MSSHHPQKVLRAQFSLYVNKSGLKPDSFHFTYLKKHNCLPSLERGETARFTQRLNRAVKRGSPIDGITGSRKRIKWKEHPSQNDRLTTRIVWCWSDVFDVEPTSNQSWVVVPYLLSALYPNDLLVLSCEIALFDNGPLLCNNLVHYSVLLHCRRSPSKQTTFA